MNDCFEQSYGWVFRSHKWYFRENSRTCESMKQLSTTSLGSTSQCPLSCESVRLKSQAQHWRRFESPVCQRIFLPESTCSEGSLTVSVQPPVCNRMHQYWLIDWLIDDHLYSAILRCLEQTHCARLWFYMSDKLFIARFLNIHRSGVLTALAWLVPHETAANARPTAGRRNSDCKASCGSVFRLEQTLHGDKSKSSTTN